MATIYTGEDILIEESSTVTVEVTYPGFDPITVVLDYNITNLDLEAGLDYATMLKSNKSSISKLSVEKATAINKDSLLAVNKTAVAYSGLINKFSTGAYEEYADYIISNSVLTLFADENLQYPFPFVFSIKVSPGEFFTIPDTYAAVYLAGKKDYTVNEENLVCSFSIPFASNSDVTIVSDYCLRLCIDMLNSSKASVVTTVWTNIPVGNYLSSGSDNVLLSNDGLVFSKIIKLTGNKLYIKGVLSGDITYGTNLTDVVINLVMSEAINEYTV